MGRLMVAVAVAALAFGPASEARGDTWSRLPFPSSFYAEWHAAVYDPAGQRLVFAPSPVSPNEESSTWWQLSLAGAPEWSPLSPAGTVPPVRQAPGLAFDPVRGHLLLHGGFDRNATDLYGDLWQLTLDPVPTWERLLPTGEIPPPRAGHTLLYDEANDRLILFGGFGAGYVALNDVYVLDLSTLRWTRILPRGPVPMGRLNHAAAYDSVGRRMLIFGGTFLDEPGGYLNDLWELSLDDSPAWRRIVAQGHLPTPRSSSTMIHDPGRDQVVVFGGVTEGSFGSNVTNDTWVFDLKGGMAWDSISTFPLLPQPRYCHSAAYFPATRSMLAFGGVLASTARFDVWRLALDGAPRWVPVSGPVSTMDHPTAIHDRIRNRMVVFGTEATNFVTTAALSLGSGRTWEILAAPGPVPSPRWGHSAIYDTRRDRMVVFGGAETGVGYPAFPRNFNDVWTLPLSMATGWVQLVPRNAGPEPRAGHTAVYDPIQDRMIVMGGYYTGGFSCGGRGCSSIGYMRDVWALSLEDLTWSQLPGDFNLFIGQTAIFDSVGDRVLLYGGSLTESGCGNCGSEPCCQQRTSYFPSVRALPLAGQPQWETVAVDSAPPAHHFHSTVFDPVRGRMLVFGGTGPDVVPRDVWSFGSRDAPRWVRLSPSGPVPPDMVGHVAVYDPVGDAMWVYDVASPRSGSVWKLTFDATTAVRIARTNVTANSELVSLTWSILEDAPDSAIVLRSATPGEWVSLEAIRGHRRTWTFVDRNIEPSVRYGYRLVVWEGAHERVADEVWIVIPRRLLLALHGVSPNPSTGELRTSFTLPMDAPAVLELMDVAGRSVARLDVTRLGVGKHEVELGRHRTMPSGIYFVRLTQSSKTLTARVALTR